MTKVLNRPHSHGELSLEQRFDIVKKARGERGPQIPDGIDPFVFNLP
jgi:hypothetical protein